MKTHFAGLSPGPRNLITDIDGLTVGNAVDAAAMTGTTVLLAEPAAIAAVDVRGGAPGTRETDALDPACLVERVDAIVLTGGSVYGLDAASAVTIWLGSRGRGFPITKSLWRAPIVPAAVIQDLNHGGDKGWGDAPPYRRLGSEACAAASDQFALGNEGAGLGARAGALKGGLGSASVVTAGGLAVGALAVVNSFGSTVVPGSGRFWAAPFAFGDELGRQPSPGASFDPTPAAETTLQSHGAELGGHTTLAIVATNADLRPGEAQRIAMMAHDGMARAIRPVHSPIDGDSVFALATGAVPLPEPRAAALALLGGLAADTLARAIGRGVHAAATLGDMTSWRDRYGRSGI